MVFPAMMKEEGSFNLDCVLFSQELGLAVTTDGRRLHSVKADVGKTVKVPTKMAKVMAALAEKDKELTFSTDGNCVKIALPGDVLLQSTGHEANYPDVSAYIKEHDSKMIIGREEVEQAFKQAMLLKEKSEFFAVKMKLNGGIDIEYNNPEMGAYQKVQIPAKQGLGDNEITMGMNAKYFLDAISTAGKTDDITISVVDGEQPMTFSHHDFFGLVMPSRI
jgi:DNA polymerase III sliding clamp (beta) subunit (PCNA family)